MEGEPGTRGLCLQSRMTFRLAIVALTLSLAAGGCTTTTAHRLPFADNPLREQALACEAKCRPLATPSSSGRDQYAGCIDGCPGAVVTNATICPAPVPGVICVETQRSRSGWGVVLVIGSILLTLVLLSSALKPLSFG